MIYWTLKSIPQLSDLPRRERGRRWRKVSAKALLHWETWVGMAGLAAIGWLGIQAGKMLGWPLLGMVAGAGVGAFVMAQLATSVIVRYYGHLLSEPD